MSRGVDSNKDQSYFLWTLTYNQLQKTLFPVGHLPKNEVRALAEKYKLPTAKKKDSQGICFLGQVNIHDFLSHYINLKDGDVLSEEGLVIGSHKGAMVYTIGQRHGFTITDKTLAGTIFYVTDKDVAKNIITVSNSSPTTEVGSSITLRDYVLRNELKVGETIEAQTRYRQNPFLVTVSAVSDYEVVLIPKDVTETPATGQSCVLYRGKECIGGGIIV